jgi:tRNA G18 (ribose-2'-O)-methylase SpoU
MSNLKNDNFPVEVLTAPTDADTRNVIDYYKYWSVDAIRADLDTKRTQLVIVCENFAKDLNIGTVIRNANAFTAKEIIIAGRRRWDRRGAVGTHSYEKLSHVKHVKDMLELYAGLKADGYQIVVMDNIDGSSDIREFDWPAKTAMILGQEDIGVSPIALKAADHVVYIPQFGSTRSINVGSASAIAMYDYMLKTQ